LNLPFYFSLFALARRTTAQSPTKEIYIAAGAAFTKSSRLACSCTRVDKVLKLNGLSNKVAGNSFTQSTNTKSIAEPSEPFIIGKYILFKMDVLFFPRDRAACSKFGEIRPSAASVAP